MKVYVYVYHESGNGDIVSTDVFATKEAAIRRLKEDIKDVRIVYPDWKEDKSSDEETVTFRRWDYSAYCKLYIEEKEIK